MAPNFKTDYVIFGDGACSGNPGQGGWGSIVSSPEGTVVELGGYSPSTTNNRMELTALIEALKFISADNKKIWVLSDSVYVLRGASEWRFGWQRKNWKTAEGQPVANQELWQEFSKIVQKFERSQIQYGYVPGHKGFAGNERVDQIAVDKSQQRSVNLYSGPTNRYSIELSHLPDDLLIPKVDFLKGEKKKAYSYLSVIGGIAMRHNSWPECESRVKGQSGAKFKKAMSAEEEAQILAEWGIDYTKLQ